MAGGRDLTRQSPSWVNALIWSSGLGAAACLMWRLLMGDGEPTASPPSLATLVPRLVAIAVLPAVIVFSIVERAVKRIMR